MEKYNYKKAIINDLKDWIIANNWIEATYGNTNPDYSDLKEDLYDTLLTESSVTGNGLNKFYDTEEKCEEYICHNLILYFEILRESDSWPIMYDIKWLYENPAQHIDSDIRCYLLWECIDKALKELGIKNDSSAIN